MSQNNNEIIDKRLVQRHLSKGVLTREAFAAHLENLPDQESEAENIWPMIMEGTQSETSVKVSTEELENVPVPTATAPIEDTEEGGVPAAVDFGS